MTRTQRTAAIETAQALPYQGFETLVVQANGRWVAPANSAHDPDCLAFRWLLDEESGTIRYLLVPRAGDELHDQGTVQVLVRGDDDKLRWEAK